MSFGRSSEQPSGNGRRRDSLKAAPGPGLVSVVIPCHDPDAGLLEAIASARAQTGVTAEVILVNDGSADPRSLDILAAARDQADGTIDQPNRGVSAARNAGFRAASAPFVIPLDSDDLLMPDFARHCLDAARANPEAAFVYTDYRVFGRKNYVERLPGYNLYDLMRTNTVPYNALIRKQDWIDAGGYDESLPGYEDWEFWLRLASRRRFGHHVPAVLWKYRRAGTSLFDLALERHQELVARITAKHPELFSPVAHARIKTTWSPAVCVVGPAPVSQQTIVDWERLPASARNATGHASILAASRAGAYLLRGGAPPADAADPGYDSRSDPSFAAALDPQLLERAALAAWGHEGAYEFADGSIAITRAAAAGGAPVRRPGGDALRRPLQLPAPRWQALETVMRHLSNAELLSLEAWLKRPVQSAARLIPLRIKERINRALQRPFFDLSFYLKFQPESLEIGSSLVKPLHYVPRRDPDRRQVALVIPHLGPGGAESVLMEFAAALDPARFEILLIATHSEDNRWLPLWRDRVDHVFDLRALVDAGKLSGAVFSIVRNWRCGTLVVQNSLVGYSVVPHLKKDLPELKTIDIVHAADGDWDLIGCTASVSREIDVRVAISQKVRQRLLWTGVPAERIHLIRNGVDLERFAYTPLRENPAAGGHRILFAGRLDEVKRPMLLVEIARILDQRRPGTEFRFVVAGDGPAAPGLRTRVERAKLTRRFEFLGHVPDLAPVLADSDLLAITSAIEGIPLVLLEALASGRPVVASHVGAIDEVLDSRCGALVGASEQEAEEFADAIDRLLDDPALRREMGHNGRRKVERDYSRARAVRSYGELVDLTLAVAAHSAG